MGFPGGLSGKESACSAGDLGSIPGSRRSPEKWMATHSKILAGEFHGQRNLTGYSLWGWKRVGPWLSITFLQNIHMHTHTKAYHYINWSQDWTNILNYLWDKETYMAIRYISQAFLYKSNVVRDGIWDFMLLGGQ